MRYSASEKLEIIRLVEGSHLPVKRTYGLALIAMLVEGAAATMVVRGVYLKSVAPPNITLAAIFRSFLPFIGIQIMVLMLIMLAPETTTFFL